MAQEIMHPNGQIFKVIDGSTIHEDIPEINPDNYQGSVINKKGEIIEGCTLYLSMLNATCKDNGITENKFINVSEPDYFLNEDGMIVPILEPWKFYKFGGKIQRYLYFSEENSFIEWNSRYWYPEECPERKK